MLPVLELKIWMFHSVPEERKIKEICITWREIKED